MITFNPISKAAVEKALQFHKGPLSVCDFGNQRYTADKNFPLYGGMSQYWAQVHNAHYIAMDIIDEHFPEHETICVDLNKPVWIEQHSYQYDLVINNGTSEHLFNQYQVFRNMHDLCVYGGIMLNVVPFTPWINHGFYNYNPIFFRDLVAANDYEPLFLWISDRNGNGAKNISDDVLFKEKCPDDLVDIVGDLSAMTDIFIAVAYKKMQAKPFRTPIQGKYHRA